MVPVPAATGAARRRHVHVAAPTASSHGLGNTPKYPGSFIDSACKDASKDGFVLLPSVFPVELVDRLAELFAPMLETRLRVAPDTDRGPGRYYLSPPFTGPWCDPRLIAQPDILKVVEHLVGPDFVLCQLGVDVPLGGGSSADQDIHRDTMPLFPHAAEETPSFQLAVNVPLCDILPAKRGTSDDNGPVEVHAGSHNWTPAFGEQTLAWGGVECKPVHMRKGDALIRDVRGLHRGTANYSPTPRPMLVLGYSIKWLRRPEVGLSVSQEDYANSPQAVQHMLRHERVVESVQAYTGVETYGADALEQTSGGSFAKDS